MLRIKIFKVKKSLFYGVECDYMINVNSLTNVSLVKILIRML